MYVAFYKESFFILQFLMDRKILHACSRIQILMENDYVINQADINNGLWVFTALFPLGEC